LNCLKSKNIKPTDSGESPLSKIQKWVNVKCPKCGGSAQRELMLCPIGLVLTGIFTLSRSSE